MRSKIALLVAGVVLFAAFSVGLVLFLRRAGRRSGGMEDMPRNAVVVSRLDAARLRAYGPVQRLLRWGAQREAARGGRTATTRAACGFDPLERVDTVTWALDAGPTQRGPFNQVVLVTGRASTAERIQCLTTWLREEGSYRLVPAGTARSRPLLNLEPPPPPTSDPFALPSQVAVLGDGILATPPAFMPAALAVVDRQAPGADRNERMRRALALIGPDAVAYTVADVTALMASLPAFSGGAGSREATLMTGMLGPYRQSELAAFGLHLGASGARLSAAVQLPTPADAQQAVALVQTWLPLARIGLSGLLATEQNRALDRLRAQLPTRPALAGTIHALERSFRVVNSLPDRLRLRAEGATARFDLELPQQDVEALENGVRAGAEASDLLLPAP